VQKVLGTQDTHTHSDPERLDGKEVREKAKGKQR
jgi:hypothetical protein